MKKTLTANIGGIVFHVDEDAFDRLDNYLNAIKMRYSGTDASSEIIDDIEMRIAELLTGRITHSKQVVTNDDVTYVIETLGHVEDFEGDNTQGNSAAGDASDQAFRRLYRDEDDKIIAGVCSGIAAYFDTDPVWVRVAFIVTTLLFSVGFWIYLVMWIIVPKAQNTRQKLEMRGKKINISNIENSIKEDLNDLKNKFNDFTGEAKDSIKKNSKPRKGIEKFIYFILNVIKHFVKSIGILIGLAFIFLGVFLFIGFISSFFNAVPIYFSDTVPGFSAFSIPELLETFFPSPIYIYVALIGIIFLIATPLLMFIYYGFKLVFGFKYSSKIIGFTTFSLWIIGLVLCIISAFQVARNFSNKGVVTEKYTSALIEGQKVVLEIDGSSAINAHFESEALHIGQIGITNFNNANVLFGMPHVEINDKSRSDELEVLLLFDARGYSKEDALKNAGAIKFPVEIKDTLITMPAYFVVDDNFKWRHQNLKVQINVPAGHDIIYSQTTRTLLDKMN